MKNNFSIIVAKVNRSLVAFCVKNNGEFLFARRIIMRLIQNLTISWEMNFYVKDTF